ncbi:MAG: TetR/AcrR family transcriptional regulator [Polyangiaceae bacterium]|nr:TetR/AcrR family transcriptional regulator [Polyangiaceae bacterium]
MLYKDGPAALTTGRIAESAGVAQPTFYVHFSDMSDALQQAADVVSEKLLGRLRELRRDVPKDMSGEAARQAIAASVNGLLSDPKSAELFLRHRRDVGTPLGRTWRQMSDRAREELLSDLRELGFGDSVPHLELHSELIAGMVLGVVEGVLDKRIKDKELAIDVLSQTVRASLAASAARSAAAAE